MSSQFYSKIQDLLQKDMTRKEFLKYTGSLLLMVTGVFSFFNAITNPIRTKGYGSQPYGGPKGGDQ